VLEGLRYLRQGLPRAFDDGADLDARSHMMLAALMGGVGLQKGLGAAHALAHAIGSVLPVHHGTICAVLLPHVIRFNAPAAGPKVCELACALGCSLSGTDPTVAGDELAEHIRDLAGHMRLPRTLAHLGLAEDQFDATVALAMDDPCMRTNPRACTADDLHDVLVAAACVPT